MSTCSYCKESKKDDEFYITKKKDDEHGSVIKDRKCKKCRIAYNSEWRRKKKQKIKKEESSSNDISPDPIDVLLCFQCDIANVTVTHSNCSEK